MYPTVVFRVHILSVTLFLSALISVPGDLFAQHYQAFSDRSTKKAATHEKLSSYLDAIGNNTSLLSSRDWESAERYAQSQDVARVEGHPPYPILFVHGLTSDHEAWNSIIDDLYRERGWGRQTSSSSDPPDQTFYASLNSDPTSTRLEDDVVTSFSNCCNQFSDGDLFTISFAVEYDPNTGEAFIDRTNDSGRSDSYESAAIKQGYALRKAIQEILKATGEEKVILVGHSMGGLAIREYLQRRDSDDRPRWWVAPNQEDGHSVARVVTYGTPHRGSNFGTVPSPFNRSSEDKISILDKDTRAEAVRDLRYTYTLSGEEGRYLFGGYEGWGSNFYNEDVNADGDELDFITGINNAGIPAPSDGTTYNPAIPLPNQIPYTWITSDNGGFGTGDGVVSRDRQWLYSEDAGQRVPVPSPSADTLLTRFDHTEEPSDVDGLLRGMDEPDILSRGYHVPVNQPQGHFIDGYFTAQSGTDSDTFEDWDTYQFDFDPSADSTALQGSATLTLPELSSDSSWAVHVTENGFTIGGLSSPRGTTQPVQLTVSTVRGYTNGIAIRSRVSGYASRREYSFRVDTRELQQFEYDPRHGSYADSTNQGFASLIIPSDVPTQEGAPLDVGDEIGVFTPGGQCVGASVWEGHTLFVSAHGNEQGGLSQGDSLRVRFWDKSTNTVYRTDGKLTGNNGKYTPGSPVVAEELKSASVLPVELVDLRAVLSNQSVYLTWKTVSETNNAGFEIQRKAYDPNEREPVWTSIGRVEGQGTTAEAKTYRFSDEKLPSTADTLRYRLKQIDQDGSATFSELLTVARPVAKQVNFTGIYPNPASDRIIAEFAVPSAGSLASTKLQIIDVIGRVVHSESVADRAGRHRVEMDISGLTSGLYLLRLRGADTVVSRKITIVQ